MLSFHPQFYMLKAEVLGLNSKNQETCGLGNTHCLEQNETGEASQPKTSQPCYDQ